MIDFHSHILPGMDDGSRNVHESRMLLRMLSEQGVKTVVATPHFYANDETVEDFLERRNQAFHRLHGDMQENMPNILCGAEVKYYAGISRMQELSRLCIENSSLLLIEMPMTRWTEYTIKELVELAGRSDVTVALAHVERYRKFQSESSLYRLYENGIRMQFNASYFLNFQTKRKAISMIQNGEIHMIGSDCHNTTSRPPRIGKAFEVIRSKLGEDFLQQFNEYSKSVLDEPKYI